MKQTVKIEWFQDVPENHKSELELAALKRVTEMVEQGYVMGELHAEIEDITYSGWWDHKLKSLDK